jgi:hypothetical protein
VGTSYEVRTILKPAGGPGICNTGRRSYGLMPCRKTSVFQKTSDVWDRIHDLSKGQQAPANMWPTGKMKSPVLMLLEKYFHLEN